MQPTEAVHSFDVTAMMHALQNAAENSNSPLEVRINNDRTKKVIDSRNGQTVFSAIRPARSPLWSVRMAQGLLTKQG